MTEKGEIFPLVIIATTVILISTLVTITGSQLYFNNATYAADSEKAINLAEAGIDKALQSLNKTGGSYTGEIETFLGDGSYSVQITSKDAATKIVEATSYLPDKNKAKVKRTVKIETTKGVGVAFVYGVQVGEGGMELGNNNVVQGSIYSNGNVIMGNSNATTGDIWVAGGPQGTPDQQTDCSGANCADFIFGKAVGGEQRLDVASSFKPAISEKLNKISLKLKKFGTPPDLTVRILRDDNGEPDKNGVLTNGTLFAGLVTTNYGWIDVTFNSTPNLNANTTYWMMIDTSSDSNNYWSIQNDLAQSYTRGSPSWSPNWNTGNPNWNTVLGDFSFQVVMGGAVTSVRAGTNNNTVGGNVHANTIENLSIQKDAYYQTIINSTVSGTSFPGTADPPPKVFPISDANINEWKNQAEDSGEQTGNITSCVTTLDSKKYSGNISFDSNCTVTVKSPIWITGNLSLGSNNTLKLDSSYGSGSGIMVVDGLVDLNNGNQLKGTDTGNSILMVLSTYDSRTSGVSSIKVNNTGNSGAFYANKGIIEPGNSNQFKELTAWQIKITNNSTINYETGLASSLFTSGPSGSYSLVKGTYQVK